ncbi:MAG: signal transduction histidine kinase with CheB and CheR [Fibrobacteres bacterium]|nr:signal transduction histidine kinase with CheB and CheR [Fibrobacterota bacterium]
MPKRLPPRKKRIVKSRATPGAPPPKPKAAAPNLKVEARSKPPREEPQAVKPPPAAPMKPFPIAGIGASAGGLEAFRRLLGALPAETRLPFVIIQHLSPTHESILPEILSKYTALKVVEAADGMAVKEAHIYVMPPNTTMSMDGRRLRLHPREGANGHMPVDSFFRSLAQEHPNHSIAIILSGAGTDGSLGIREIKDAGGITFAQDDISAKFDSMPRSAVSTGAIDFVLSPEAIAAELHRICRNLQEGYTGREKKSGTDEDLQYAEIFALVRRVTQVDFSQYKQPTVIRRITRRMLLCRADTLGEYLEFLKGHPGEIHLLYQDILIKVTSFFRDKDAFESLKKTILPALIKARTPESGMRIWVPGCCTGEEVYSIAIAVLECIGDASSNVPVQIFATDISEEALAKARAGIYLENIALDVSPERLRRFFTRVNSHYQVSKFVRDMCVFARHDLTRDHPFSRIDLISCRNLLIYLDAGLQKKVFPTFHYSLKPDGYLMLGTSETVGGFTELFNLVDKKQKIYSKKYSTTRYALPPGGAVPYQMERAEPGKRPQDPSWSALEVQKEADRVALASYVPPGVVINGDMDILQFRGQTGDFLEPAPGQATLNLMKMLRQSLMLEVRRTVDRCKKTGEPAKTQGVELDSEGKRRKIDVEVLPLQSGPDGQASYYLVLFLERSALVHERPGKKGRPAAKGEDRSRALRKELESTKDYLQSIIEEQEVTNEELKSANEEVLSSNEELQSINEELETAKEELQSTNEELTTLNEELHTRNVELNSLNNDISNLLHSVNVPILMLGNDLRIRRFTPVAEKVLNLIPTDIGRPFSDLKLNISLPNLLEMIRDVIDTITVKEMEVQTSSGNWFSLRIRPYRTFDNKIDGAVLVFIDIDAIKESLRQVKVARAYSESIVETVATPLVVVEADGRVRTGNRAYLAAFPGGRAEVIGRSVLDSGFGGRPIPGLDALIMGPCWGQPVRGHEVDVPNPGGARTLLIHAGPLPAAEGEATLMLLAIEDITERKRAENSLRNLVAELESFSYTVSHDLRAPLRAMQGLAEALREDYSAVLDETGRDYTGRIIGAAQKMESLIHDLLSYSRLGQSERIPRVCSLDDAVGEALSQLEKEIRDRGAEVSVARPLGNVMGHSSLLATILMNLIGNALKFVESGTRPKVLIHSRKAEGSVRLWVEDNGIGIDPEHHGRIFRVFERLHGAERYPGTGIGLAIVRKGLESMGGKAGVESRPGHGSRFWMELPMAEAAG